MMMLTTIILLIFIISLIMMTIATIISKKTYLDREKSSPFECGFDSKSSARLSFSLQFFLVAVVFLIFDVEIVLLIPMALIAKTSGLISYSCLFAYFIIILIGGLYHEWKQGALNWAI